MKFKIDYNRQIAEQRNLIYSIEDYSFDTEPSVQEINFDIVINKLNLGAVDEDNRIVQIWGFSGYNEWIKANYDVPESKAGVLKVVDYLQSGLAYKISDFDFPVHVNVQTGWVCIGDPNMQSNAVEFINRCIAVIGVDNELNALWLQPQLLPNIKS